MEPEPAAEPVRALRPETLAALPKELRAALRNALVALDADRPTVAIGRISEQDSALGSALAWCAGRFAYTAIFDALDASKAQLPAESR
jgi:hypothetical protein